MSQSDDIIIIAQQNSPFFEEEGGIVFEGDLPRPIKNLQSEMIPGRHMVINESIIECFAREMLLTGSSFVGWLKTCQALDLKYDPKVGPILEARPETKAIINRLREDLRAYGAIDVNSHMTMLAHLRDQASIGGKHTAAIMAEISRGKVAGLYEKSDGIEAGKDYSELSTEKLRQMLLDAKKEGGIITKIEQQIDEPSSNSTGTGDSSGDSSS